MDLSDVTRPGVDPGTFLLVAQRLTHYATQGPTQAVDSLEILYPSYNLHVNIYRTAVKNLTDIVTFMLYLSLVDRNVGKDLILWKFETVMVVMFSRNDSQFL